MRRSWPLRPAFATFLANLGHGAVSPSRALRIIHTHEAGKLHKRREELGFGQASGKEAEGARRGQEALKAQEKRNRETFIQGSPAEPPDHRKIGSKQALWTIHPSSPGSPIFTPEGTHVFQTLQAFLRAQYPAFGFQEVVTPTIYKQSLWEQSGHWENYKDDIFTVRSGKPVFRSSPESEANDNRLQPVKAASDDNEGTFGLKPMNCPGHCILYASQLRSYRDLPIRYADFSPLHRDEVSGALSGLTRLRRFHQDDGHIFCRPSQVREEIEKSLELMRTIYRVLGVHDFDFVLSTRPDKNFMGTEDEWASAEIQLKEALESSHRPFKENEGDGAFYGPKIDAIMTDASGKKHQIGTIQLDFQLPKRFELSYAAPKPLIAIKSGSKSAANSEMGLEVPEIDRKGVPVMIHRAILGSLERFMALLMEQNKGQWPFWLHPRPATVLTVKSDDPAVRLYAERVVRRLRCNEIDIAEAGLHLPRQTNAITFRVDFDDSNETVAKKVAKAKEAAYAIIVVIGQRNVVARSLDVDVAGIPNQLAVWSTIEAVRSGSQAPVQKDGSVGTQNRGHPGVKLSMDELQEVMRNLKHAYV